MILNIDTIVRFHDFNYLQPLKDCLLSLAGQLDVAVRPLIICQDFKKSEMARIKNALQDFETLFQRGIVFDSVATQGRDMRAKLINRGFDLCESNYVAILDCDDVIYCNAYSTLCGKLLASDAAIAFGAIVWAEVEMINGFSYTLKKDFSKLGGVKFDLFVDNFCPIHSFVIDRSRVEASDLRFVDEMTVLEDYHFLLRIVSKYPSDFSGTTHFVGEYRRAQMDTVRKSATQFDVGLTRLESARKKIDRVKEELVVSCKLSEFGKLAKVWNGSPKAFVREPEQLFQNSDFIKLNNRLIAFSKAVSEIADHLESTLAVHQYGSVDKCIVEEDGLLMKVLGWVAADDKSEFAGKVVVFGSSGEITCASVTIERPDVRAEGFSLRAGFQAVISMSNDIKVFSVDTQGLWRRLKVQSV
jgi:hypothetical protein